MSSSSNDASKHSKTSSYEDLTFWIPWSLLVTLLLLGVYREREIYRVPPILHEAHKESLREASGVNAINKRLNKLEREVREHSH